MFFVKYSTWSGSHWSSKRFIANDCQRDPSSIERESEGLWRVKDICCKRAFVVNFGALFAGNMWMSIHISTFTSVPADCYHAIDLHAHFHHLRLFFSFTVFRALFTTTPWSLDTYLTHLQGTALKKLASGNKKLRQKQKWQQGYLGDAGWGPGKLTGFDVR